MTTISASPHQSSHRRRPRTLNSAPTGAGPRQGDAPGHFTRLEQAGSTARGMPHSRDEIGFLHAVLGHSRRAIATPGSQSGSAPMLARRTLSPGRGACSVRTSSAIKSLQGTPSSLTPKNASTNFSLRTMFYENRQHEASLTEARAGLPAHRNPPNLLNLAGMARAAPAVTAAAALFSECRRP